ncbi:hypothetical protein DICPUDRAFT_45403 [Dictyostelium purpureum]|uniref:DNA-directed RNA polymerase III subunit RPC3 n=1 Tax=Dictyostelium purpureum TaxID=5786 RepID=F0ZAC3_DICPU|nr:uncharacterized protein DICPUDRAFT_45403 [Dictyostelium purpureum]EGC39126.1 hypothetical protein DICPUDRAFT_45403 [Dictyostelium purpureum]|eukprot:XP_003284378.1 hypothetical protein DICPUDRAFT_45403 [Dictyostelium purpureum]
MYEQKLAIGIVNEAFGDDVSKVFEFLVHRGKSSFKIINQALQGTVGLKRIKQCLLVLIQHNLATFEEFLIPLGKDEQESLTPGDPFPSDSVYEAIIVNAIHRLRFPKFINFIKVSKGDEAAFILEELIDHGRLPMDMILKQASAYSRAADSFEDTEEITKRFEDIFTKLIMDQFIMRAPRPRPINDQDQSNAINKEAKKTKDSQSSSNKKEADPFALPAGFSSNGPLSNDNLPNLPLDILTGGGATNNGSSAPLHPNGNKTAKKNGPKVQLSTTTTTTTSSKSTSKTTGKKRKNIVEEDDEANESPDVLMISESAQLNVHDIGDSNIQPNKKSKLDVYTVVSPQEQQQRIINDETRVLWTINYEQFVTEFKLKACYDFVVEKNNQQSGLLFNAMVKLCKRSIRSNSDTLTSCVYGENALEEYNRDLDPSKRMDKLQFEKYLSVMQASRPSMVTKMQTKSKQSSSSELGAYQVNVGNIIAVIKQKMVESIIKQKFGDNGLRVFKLLLIKNLLEPKQIADLAMIPIKECKALLFNMMQKNIIRLQEVPRSSDHFANRTFYLFFVDLPSIIRDFTEDIFKAIYNTRERLNSELAPHKDMLDKMSELDEESPVTEDQTKIFKKTDRITQTLLTVILNLDNDLLHLYSF